MDSNLVNLVDESRGFKSRESRGWISWMDLVDSDLVNIIEGVSTTPGVPTRSTAQGVGGYFKLVKHLSPVKKLKINKI